MSRYTRVAALATAIGGLFALSGCAVGFPRATTGVGLTSATLNGDIYSNFDGNTEYWWRYGGRTLYGLETPHRTIAISDDSAHPVSEPLTGLSPNTTYHFQLCARDGEESPPRTNCSKDQTFSTASAIGASRIAFTSFVDADSELFKMGPTGTGPMRLTTNSFFEATPAWSPNAGKIAFYSDRSGNWDIWVMDADGTDPLRLTTDPAFDGQPTWSPDGTKIAFASHRSGDFHSEIYVMDADGTDVTRLTNNASVESEQPDWSPDGTRIAFKGNNAIYLVNATGGIPTAIASFGSHANPDWSADGSRIAFESGSEIFTMDPDGTDLFRLTVNSEVDLDPSWSPDGSKIAFVSRRDGDDEIWVMDNDGSDPVRLTNNSLTDIDPAWSAVPPAPTAN
jgi:Tol biopolymer transport system component